MKVYTLDIDSCFGCPNIFRYKGEQRCSKVIVRNNNYRMLHDNDVFVRDENGMSIKATLPKWCPLPDKQ